MSSDKTALGDRMKRYELASRTLLPRRTYTIIRVDGRAFHTLLRRAEKPFDWDFMETMDVVTVNMCANITGTVLAYCQSDEISLLLTDFATTQTEPWFGGAVQKMASVSAAMATAYFNEECRSALSGGMFDGRVFTIPEPVEVANYFLWRQRDAVRNSINMVAQSLYPHSELQHLNTDQVQEKMFTEKGVNWNDTRPVAKRGLLVSRHDPLGHWVSEAAPHFAVEPGNMLTALIPRLPELP